MIRDLKYYTWIFEEKNNRVVLKDKVNGKTFVFGMAMADSFVRAYISFKNRQRINEKRALREMYRRRIDRIKGVNKS